MKETEQTNLKCRGEERGHVRMHARVYVCTHAGTEGGSDVPYTVTFVKAQFSPYTGNVRDSRHLYRVRLKSQECCFLSRLFYHTRLQKVDGKWRGRKGECRKRLHRCDMHQPRTNKRCYCGTVWLYKLSNWYRGRTVSPTLSWFLAVYSMG